MECKECHETEVIKINKPSHVKFQCKKGHVWFEDYIDNGGIHQRPDSYEVKLDDVLFPSEKILYQKVLDEIGKNQEFYLKADPLEKTRSLIQNCNANEQDIYRLMKKIARFNK